MISKVQLVKDLRGLLKGEVTTQSRRLKAYSHDASLFEIRPKVVVYPRYEQDIEQLVKYVARNKKNDPTLSLTVRSGGTDMSGGAINDSIILDVARYLKRMGGVKDDKTVWVQPGRFYREFEPKTLKHDLLLPSYPASRELCTLGGMVANNSGGEKSLIYGKTDRYVKELKVILRDGKEHTFKPLTKAQLLKKVKETGLEGQIYHDLWQLIKKHQKAITASRPKVSKNSTGYNIWDVWDGETFDINKLLVGSQGTLGIITASRLQLVEAKPLSGMVVLFMPSLDKLGQVINAVLKVGPSSFESFYEHTLKFAFRFFLSFRKTLGWKRFMLLGLSFIPVLRRLLKFLPKLPKIVMLVEFEGDSQDEIDSKITETIKALEPYDIETHEAKTKKHEEKFWIMRRESFNLLRKNVRKKHTAPFIDDLIVPPHHLPEFLPKLTKILEKYELLYTVAGHMGDGNFHIIPLMDFSNAVERNKIPYCLHEVTELVLKYDGSLSGEHNDGLIRGPFLAQVFKPEVFKVQQQVKVIFDPDNIFNPHKKVDADWDYSQRHVRVSF
jgi:FAD/FMN-containing dehydrogenase